MQYFLLFLLISDIIFTNIGISTWYRINCTIWVPIQWNKFYFYFRFHYFRKSVFCFTWKLSSSVCDVHKNVTWTIFGLTDFCREPLQLDSIEKRLLQHLCYWQYYILDFQVAIRYTHMKVVKISETQAGAELCSCILETHYSMSVAQYTYTGQCVWIVLPQLCLNAFRAQILRAVRNYKYMYIYIISTSSLQKYRVQLHT